MNVAKQIVFRYNGDPATEEIDLDMDGDKSVPKQGSFDARVGITAITGLAVTPAKCQNEYPVKEIVL
jgi:hypothetical protein